MIATTEPRTCDVVTLLCESLSQYFEDGQARDDCAADIRVERLDDLSSSCTLQLYVADEAYPRAQFSVHHVGGNVYDVRGGVEGRRNRLFTYSLPDVPNPPPARTLAREIGRFLVSELKSLSGERALRRTRVLA